MTDTTADWSFDNMGPEFDEHVAAHLPGYADVQRLVALIATFHLPDGGVLADLGASTGLTVRTIADTIPQRRFSAYLYDADASMLEQARGRLAMLDAVNAHYVETDLDVRHRSAFEHTDADLTVAMWLLQFLTPAARRPLLQLARSRSAPGGAIIVATKTRMAEPRWQEVAEAALDDYKAEHGVTPEQRAAKTKALRGTMRVDTDAAIVADLRASGWHTPTLLWRWHVWSVIGAHAQPLAGS